MRSESKSSNHGVASKTAWLLCFCLDCFGSSFESGNTACTMFLSMPVGEGSTQLLRFSCMQSCSLDPCECSGYEGHETAIDLCRSLCTELCFGTAAECEECSLTICGVGVQAAPELIDFEILSFFFFLFGLQHLCKTAEVFFPQLRPASLFSIPL